MSHGTLTPPVLRRVTGRWTLVLLGTIAVAIYSYLGQAGDLRSRLGIYLPCHLALAGVMFAGWWVVRKDGFRTNRIVLIAALLFRLVAAVGEPALSDDVYRYVWDGRVQVHGFHPFRHAPDAPALESLRDEVWERINHPEIGTIYPPVAQALFATLAATGAGVVGFKMFLGLLDFGVVLALVWLARRIAAPPDRVVLYAWNPLAVMETAGSGHLEPLGVLLLVLSVGWIVSRRPILSTLALAASIQTKILPTVLIPGHVRRVRLRGLFVLVAALAVPALPYALTGPAVGGGILAYAERWERNAALYAGVEGLAELGDTAAVLKPAIGRLKRVLGEDTLPWDLLYRHVWPRHIARLAVGALAIAWVMWLAFRSNLDPPTETLWALGGVLLLAPTVHPWYLLWIAPFAALRGSPGWLSLIVLAPLAYVEVGGDVPWTVRIAEFGLPLFLIGLEAFRTLRAPANAGSATIPP